MFVDKVQVDVKAGDGGNGMVSFHQEKFVDRGGPDGGDGGNGGNVVFVASNNQNTLANFRFKKYLQAEPGSNGSKNRRHGKSGSDLVVMLPVGTVVSDLDGNILADLISDQASVIIAHGGKGGFGNAHFISSTRQTPLIAEKGESGEELKLGLELKMIADVGLIGLPNAGKSTLLSVVSHARPEIADYPFTTLVPNLGVVAVDDNTSLLFADIPGLIEGAAQGKGLGDEFLRHIERTKVLVHLIDIYNPDVVEAYKTIQAELSAYKPDLSDRPQLILLTKVEGSDPKVVEAKQQALKKVIPKQTPIMAISAQAHQGVRQFLKKIADMVIKQRISSNKKLESEAPIIPVLQLPSAENYSWHVAKQKKGFLVVGNKIEKFASRTNFNSDAGKQRLWDIMKKMGIKHELLRQGVQPGDIVTIGSQGQLEF